MDATAIQRVLAEIISKSEINETAADCDKNGFLEVVDATLIQRYLAAYEDPHGIGTVVNG